MEGAWRSIEDSAELNSVPGGKLKTSGHPDALKKPRLCPTGSADPTMWTLPLQVRTGVLK